MRILSGDSSISRNILAKYSSFWSLTASFLNSLMHYLPLRLANLKLSPIKDFSCLDFKWFMVTFVLSSWPKIECKWPRRARTRSALSSGVLLYTIGGSFLFVSSITLLASVRGTAPTLHKNFLCCFTSWRFCAFIWAKYAKRWSS